MKLGEKIRGIRTMKGLSQENMAEMLEMSVRGYGDIERGTTDIPFSRLEQIADKLGVQTTDILAYGDRISLFFDQCSSVIAGINNGGQSTSTYDQRELQYQIEKLQLENKLIQAEKERAEMEAKYWKEKLKNPQ